MEFNKLGDLKQYIESELSSYITSDYVLYDIPNHRNIGDQLIYQGELDFLKTFPFKCVDKCSVSYNFKKQINAELILLHGGGNFGDIYPFHQNFREKIVSQNHDKRIVLFPNSVQFNSKENLAKSAALFNAHPNMVICVRDTNSFDLLSKHFNKCKILLLPDMAFCSSYQKSLKVTKELAIIRRNDFELKEKDTNVTTGNYDVIDWSTFDNSFREKLHLYYYSLNRIASEFILKLTKKNSVYGLLPLRKEKEYVESGVKLLSNYNFIISTRLHGHILSLLLGIPSIIVDNNYGKNKRFYDTWLTNIPNSYYADTIEQALEIYKGLVLEKK